MGKLPSLHACNALLYGFVKMGKCEFMWDVYRNMLSFGLCPSVVTYVILIDACCLKDEIFKAKMLYDEMVEIGIQPNVVIYTTLIRGFCNENKIHEAERIFKKMWEIGVMPNLFTYNTLMDGYSKMADVGRVWGRSQISVYNCLIDGCCNSDDMSSALEMHSEMEKLGISLDVVTYGTLIKGHCNLGEVDEAERLLLKMDKTGVIVNSVVYNQLIDRYCKDRNMEKALALCSQMIEKGVQPNVVTFSILIDALIEGHFKKGNTKAALRLHKEMMEVGVAPNALTYTCLVDGFLKNGMISDAINFFFKISSSGSTGVEYFEANKFFVDLRRNGLYPDLPTYAMMVQRHFEARHITRVMMLKADMLKTGFMPNPCMYKVLLKGYQDMVDLSSTSKCYKELKDLGENARSNRKLLDWSITKAQVSPRITSVAKLWNMQNFRAFNGQYPAETIAGDDAEKLIV
ncbi:hypothetical protein RND71_010371 [Anisodus tanguticus]|uniref:Pentatricopeptide repeat-containing protein n=1 Tax=Anisodus tanguticus TaxID=243964 RepID=A0AAE1SLI0_9SOLA|nr:hypothetical protein RND71_010371 [Anisodus tanguticus]